MAGKRFQVLALGGGGYRGYFTARVLEAIAARAPTKSLLPHFDLIAGTSIGGILALGLAAGRSAKDLADTVFAQGRVIFGFDVRPFRAKYDNAGLREAIVKMIGEDLTLGDLQRPVIIPAVSLTAGGPQLFRPHREEAHREFHAVDVSLATAAAPTYFPAKAVGSNVYVDGGLIANAPDALGVHEAETFFHKSRDDIFVLGVGTTGVVMGEANKGEPDWGLVGWRFGKKVIDLTLEAQQALARELVEEMLGDRYLKIDAKQSHEQSKVVGLDKASKKASNTLEVLVETAMGEVDTARLDEFLAHKAA